MISTSRQAEYGRVVTAVADWAAKRPDIRGVAVVGSWARDAARMDSDIDFVILTDRADLYLHNTSWVADVLGADALLVAQREWGVLTERRILLPSGLEVEFGFAPTRWAATDLIDPGTSQVVAHGCRPVSDPDELFERLLAAPR